MQDFQAQLAQLMNPGGGTGAPPPPDGGSAQALIMDLLRKKAAATMPSLPSGPMSSPGVSTTPPGHGSRWGPQPGGGQMPPRQMAGFNPGMPPRPEAMKLGTAGPDVGMPPMPPGMSINPPMAGMSPGSAPAGIGAAGYGQAPIHTSPSTAGTGPALTQGSGLSLLRGAGMPTGGLGQSLMSMFGGGPKGNAGDLVARVMSGMGPGPGGMSHVAGGFNRVREADDARAKAARDLLNEDEDRSFKRSGEGRDQGEYMRGGTKAQDEHAKAMKELGEDDDQKLRAEAVKGLSSSTGLTPSSAEVDRYVQSVKGVPKSLRGTPGQPGQKVRDKASGAVYQFKDGRWQVFTEEEGADTPTQ